MNVPEELRDIGHQLRTNCHACADATHIEKLAEIAPRVSVVDTDACAVRLQGIALRLEEHGIREVPPQDHLARTKVEQEWRKYFVEVRHFNPSAMADAENIIDFVLWRDRQHHDRS